MYKNVVSVLARNGFSAVILFSFNLPSALGLDLAWNASTSPNITGYTVKYGTTSGSYPSTLNAGTALTTTLASLLTGTTYYFVVTARNSSGIESDPSPEIAYTVPGVVLPNVAPTLNTLSNVTLNEDAAPQTVTLSGISGGLGDLLGLLSVTATSSNPSLIPNPMVNYTSPNTTGSLQLTPAANATGTATITVTVNDFQLLNNLFSRTFTVTVNPVNDTPTLNPINNLSLGVSASTQTVSLSGIGSGAANESQALVVTASSSNPSLIPNPTISYGSPGTTGSLSFTPVAGATGTATITVNVNDGQSQNNTISRTFTVTASSTTKQTFYVEAESVSRTSPMTTAANANALNGQYIYSSTANQGSISVPINISQAGDYWVWGRVLSPDNARDSFFITMDSGAEEIYNTAPNSWSTAWQWTKVSMSGVPRAYTLSAGAHTLVFRCREASTFLDAVYITNDPQFVPPASGTPPPSPNVAPTLNTLGNLAITEDVAQQSVNLSGIGTGSTSETQTLTVTATSSNPSLIPNPTVTYTSPGTTGTLRFTPVANANGTATITVTVNDGQAQNNLVSRTFTVTVNAVNDAPTLNAPANLSLAINAPRQTISLTGIGSGAANESQTLTVTAASSNTGLIPTPTISYTSPGSTGSLSFTPIANATGTATITVTVNDGQSLNNTVTRSFTVTATGTTSTTQTLFVEAEAGNRSGSMVSASDSLASGGKYIYPNSYNSGAVTFNFSATSTADYWVWCRVLSRDASRDSFFVSMDGAANEIYNTSPNSWSSAWQWTRVNASGTTRVYKLTAGSHTLKFSNREMGTQLDALYITNDRNFIPPSGAILATASTVADSGDVEAVPEVPSDSTPPVVSELEVLRTDARTITLGWRTDEPAACRLNYDVAQPLGGQSPLESSFSTEHQLSITGLQPGTIYLIQVQSTDAAGNRSLGEIGRAETAPLSLFAWSATDGTIVRPMRADITEETGVIHIYSPVKNRGAALFPVHVDIPSDYVLWCRVLPPARSFGSFLITVDDSDPLTLRDRDVTGRHQWRWVRAGTNPISLDTGEHPLRLNAREAGLRIETLLLTNDPDYLPAD